MLLDIHTHLRGLGDKAIFSSSYFSSTFSPYTSVGVHPCSLTKDNFNDQIEWCKREAEATNVLAIGEVGLDKNASISIDKQIEVFKETINIAIHFNKPVIIHSVRTSNEIIALKMQCGIHDDWIIHGFRGKKELASNYLRHGFYLSFGEKYNEDALKSVPINRLFLETDESHIDISDLYKKVAHVRGMSLEKLMYDVQCNIQNVFFNRS